MKLIIDGKEYYARFTNIEEIYSSALQSTFTLTCTIPYFSDEVSELFSEKSIKDSLSLVLPKQVFCEAVALKKSFDDAREYEIQIKCPPYKREELELKLKHQIEDEIEDKLKTIAHLHQELRKKEEKYIKNRERQQYFGEKETRKQMNKRERNKKRLKNFVEKHLEALLEFKFLRKIRKVMKTHREKKILEGPLREYKQFCKDGNLGLFSRVNSCLFDDEQTNLHFLVGAMWVVGFCFLAGATAGLIIGAPIEIIPLAMVLSIMFIAPLILLGANYLKNRSERNAHYGKRNWFIEYLEKTYSLENTEEIEPQFPKEKQATEENTPSKIFTKEKLKKQFAKKYGLSAHGSSSKQSAGTSGQDWFPSPIVKGLYK